MIDNHDMTEQLRKWVIARQNPPSIAYVLLSALAAVLSYVIARLFRLPEAYWAPMSTLIVMQLTLSAAFPIAVQYVVGTAIGAAVAAVTDVYFHTSIGAFGAAVVLVGLLCVELRIERSAFRYACITLVIVMLVPRSTSGRLVALHRFFEVSIGIAVGLVLFAVWQKIDLNFPAKVSRAPLVG
jgi:uncharacterized membrane protein YgaE (UPF0421/DUF939 family)